MLYQSTLKLFKALPVDLREDMRIAPQANVNEWMKYTIPLGFVFSPIIVDNFTDREVLTNIVKDIYGLSAEKLNQSFHKSWAKVKDSPIEQLIVEQLAHYCTTYGKGHEHEYLDQKGSIDQWNIDNLASKVSRLPDFEMDKVWDVDYIYIPKETLSIPELTEDLKLVIIKGYTKIELKAKLLNLLNSGIALAEDTIKDVVEIANYVEIVEQELSLIRNKEVKCIMYDKMDLIPRDPVEFLRFVIYKITGETLLIKSKELIDKIKENNNEVGTKTWKKYMFTSSSGYRELASIFYRFKPLFLAFRDGANERIWINEIRRQARKFHKPMPEDYLNSVTGKIKNNLMFYGPVLERELSKVNIFRKVRLAYALKFRTKE